MPAVSDLELADYRRRVAGIYQGVRDRGVDANSWRWWVEQRRALFATHPQSPLSAAARTNEEMSFFAYDPSWQVVGTVEEPTELHELPRLQEGSSTFRPIGQVRFTRADQEYLLGLYWLDAYGGGLFLPFRDSTNGQSTYGAGRYLLDGAKSADLGSIGVNKLVLDFNFSYHPSCVWDPQWACPLAPRENHMDVRVEAGEHKQRTKVPQESSLDYRCERCGSLTRDGDGHDCC